eukprot:scaffold699_cov385-Prasinococcus_capsulatus_cf.AAC.20
MGTRPIIITLELAMGRAAPCLLHSARADSAGCSPAGGALSGARSGGGASAPHCLAGGRRAGGGAEPPADAKTHALPPGPPPPLSPSRARARLAGWSAAAGRAHTKWVRQAN